MNYSEVFVDIFILTVQWMAEYENISVYERWYLSEVFKESKKIQREKNEFH